MNDLNMKAESRELSSDEIASISGGVKSNFGGNVRRVMFRDFNSGSGSGGSRGGRANAFQRRQEQAIAFERQERLRREALERQAGQPRPTRRGVSVTGRRVPGGAVVGVRIRN